MRIRTALGAVLLLVSVHARAQVAPYFRAPVSSAADLAAITQLTVDFRSALIRRDVVALTDLLLDKSILFASPPSPNFVRTRRERGQPGFTGAEAGGFADFAAFVAGSPVPIEERFYNIKVTQDGHLAWVSFDFEFLAAGKVENYGIEAWQLLKTVDDRWKIMSVVWSSHGAPK